MLRRVLLTAAGISVLLPLSMAQLREVEEVNGKAAAAREVLVRFRSSAVGPLQRLVRDEDAGETQGVGSGGVVRIKSRSKNIRALLESLSRNQDVELAEPNYIVYATKDANDYYYNLLWGLKNTGQVVNGQSGTPGADIDATSAWDISTGSTANVVGIVDTGVDYTHPDLAGNIWSAPGSFTVNVGGKLITCAAGTHGFNAIKETCDPLDDNGHGTHVSGTIGAAGNNSAGVAGVNWTASIVGLKFLDSSGSGTTADAINAIEFAVQLKQQGLANVRVLNNSWGGGGSSQSLLNEINKANTNGMMFVAAAGNTGANNDATASYPANYTAPNVVAVAATDNRDALASFSNYGASTVDLGAPGVYIASTYPKNSYAYMSGTSMATPHVSGAAALVLSKCTALSTAGLIAALLNNVDPVESLAGKTVTGGRLNVYRAINSCSGTPTPDFSMSASPAAVSVTRGNSAAPITVTVTGSNSFGGTVALDASGLPAGATAGFAPPSSSGSFTSTLTISTSSTTPAGTYTVTVRGTSGSTVRTCTVTLTVTAPVTQSFTLSVSPASRAIRRGQSTTFTVGVTPSGGFNSSVTLTVSGLPSGASATFSRNPVPNGSGTSTMTVTTTSRTAAGTYTLAIKGDGGGLTKKALASLQLR